MRPITDIDSDQASTVFSRTGLKVFGRVDRLPPTYQNPNKDRFDKTFSEYLLKIGHNETYPDFGVCRPSQERELKAVSRYGLPHPEIEPSAEEVKLLYEWLDFEFGPHVEGYRIIEFDEVEIQHATTPGIPYKWYVRTKADAMKAFAPDIVSFWNDAHKLCPNVYWHNFVKTELLPTAKLDVDDVRSITGPDIAYHFSVSRMSQDFNHRMYEAVDSFSTASALGFNKFEGGLNRLADKVNELPYKEEADMSKYDARQARWLRMMCCYFRWKMLRQEDKTEENWMRLVYYYSQAIDSKLVLGMGWVLGTDHGMKSGDTNTSADNTLIHFIVLSLAYIRLVSDDYGHFKRNVRPFLYGDDELLSMSDEVVHLFSAEHRAPIYEECGIHLKVEAAKLSHTLEGLSFLGNKFVFDHTFNVYVGVPVKPRKTIASLLKPPSKLTPGQTLTRAVGLLMESVWHKENRDLIHGFIQYLVKRGVEMDLRINDSSEEDTFDLSRFKGRVPTVGAIMRLWTGLE